MFLPNIAVIHMVENSTQFCAAQFLKSHSSKDIWKSILWQWVLKYSSPPDYLHVDQESGFISWEMAENAETAGISIREAKIETPRNIGAVKRYHAPLGSA